MAQSKSSSPRRAPDRDPAPVNITWDERLIHSLTPLKIELLGGLLLLATLLTLLGTTGLLPLTWLNGWAALTQKVFGWGIYPLCLLLALGGLHLITRRVNRRFRLRPGQIIGLELLLLTALPLSYLYTQATLNDALQGRGGGLVGWALGQTLLEFLGPLLTLLFYGGLLLLGVLLFAGVRWQSVRYALLALSGRLHRWGQQIAPPPRQPRPAAPPQPVPPPQINRQRLPQAANTPAPTPAGAAPRHDPRLPPLSLLEAGVVVNLSDAEIEQKKAIVEQTLRDFGLSGEVTEIRRGPAVTQFGVTPGYIERPGPDGEMKLHKVRVSQIAALQNDLALSLAVTRLRVQAPVPGRGIVGIEIPNAETNVVRIRTVIESSAFTRQQHPLAVALGQSVAGAPVAINLAKMPHLLIAGTTGSGKSVCLNAFIACLVFNNTPEQLKLLMIDPKKVELIRFNGLPHLLGKVEVEHERVIGVLRWLTNEMDARYELFATLGAKNLEAYNQKVARHSQTQPLPYIAVFIDELADLMAMFPGDVERALCRLAQMARATGIHLIVATQRPSTDVLTGLIKANFPARISFSVASNIDSRVILDSVGAEQLLGRGDMLFLSSDSSNPERVQGCFVSDNEIERLVAHWQRAMPNYQPGEAPWESLLARMAHIDETDDMLEEAIELAQEHENLSASFLQRRLRVGYPRAARLMEALHDMGLVEDPQNGGRTRRSYADSSDEDPLGSFLSEQ